MIGCIPEYLQTHKLFETSIINTVFKKDKKGEYLQRYCKVSAYPDVIVQIIRLASSVVQVYVTNWCIQNNKLIDSDDISVRLRDVLSKIWKEGKALDLNDHIDILVGINDNRLGIEVKSSNITVFDEIQRLIYFNSDQYEGIRVDLEKEFQLELILIDLIEYLAFLTELKITIKDNGCFFTYREQDFNCYPYIEHLTFSKSSNEYIYTLAKVEKYTNNVILQYINIDAVSYVIDIEEVLNQSSTNVETLQRILSLFGIRKKVVDYNVTGSYQELGKIIKITIDAFKYEFGTLSTWQFIERIKRFLKELGIKDTFEDIFERDAKSYTNEEYLEKLYNYLWIVLLERGIFAFFKAAIKAVGFAKVNDDINERIKPFVWVLYCDENILNGDNGEEITQEHKDAERRYNEEVESLVQHKISLITSIFPDDSLYYKQRVEFIESTAMIIVILNKIGIDTSNIFIDYSQIASIHDYIEYVENGKSERRYLSLEPILKFLVCFYQGVYAHLENLESQEEHIDNYQIKDNKADKIMLEAARVKYDEMTNDQSIYLTNLIVMFKEIVKKIDNKKWSYKYFGRKQILSEGIINELFSIKDERNFLSHFKGQKLPATEESEELNRRVLKILKYFMTGRKDILHYSPESIDYSMCIYPQVVSFKHTTSKRNNINVIGYETCTTTLYDDEFQISSKIILTNQRVKQFKEYYCLPHVQRSNSDFLIEPFLISCDEFDKAAPVRVFQDSKSN